MKLETKNRAEKLKTKNQSTETRKTKAQKDKNLVLPKELGRKCRVIYITRAEQNNNNTQIKHKIQFRSSFK